MRVDYVDEDGVVYTAKQVKEFDYKLLKKIEDERIENRADGTKHRIRYTTKLIKIRTKTRDLLADQ